MENSMQKLVFDKSMSEGVKRAVRERLKIILEDTEKSLAFFNDNTKHRLNTTSAEQASRRQHKIIQALKIVIHFLTPYGQRMEVAPPSFVVRKAKKAKEIKGYLPPSTTDMNRIPEQKMPSLSQDQISLLANLADLLKTKN